MSVKDRLLAGGVPWYGLAERLSYEHKERIFRLAGYEPHENQRRIHESTARMRIVVCGRRFGKSTLAAYEALAFAALGGRVWVVAPDYDLASIVYEQAVHAALSSELSCLVSHPPRTARGMQLIRFSTGGWIAGKSSVKPRTLVGRGLDLVIFDECSKEVNPEVWQAYLRPALTDRRGGLLAITTPMGDDWVKGLYDRGVAGEPGYESFRMTSYDNPLLDPREIDGAREELPDAVFRQEYLAEFLDAEGAVFPGYRELATGRLLGDPEEHRPYVIGVDLARYEDYTAACVMDAISGAVVDLVRSRSAAYSVQRAMVDALARRWNHAEVLVDATGVGDPFVEELSELSGGDYRVSGFVFTAASKARLVNQAIVAMSQREVVLPSPEQSDSGRSRLAEAFLAEIGSFRYSKTAAGTIKTGAPPGRHDDLVMAFCLAIEARMRHAPSAVVAPSARREEVPVMAGRFASGRSRPFREGRFGRPRS